MCVFCFVVVVVVVVCLFVCLFVCLMLGFLAWSLLFLRTWKSTLDPRKSSCVEHVVPLIALVI